MLKIESNDQGIVIIPLFKETSFSNGETLESKVVELSFKEVKGYFSYQYSVTGSAVIELYVSHTGEDYVLIDSVTCTDTTDIRTPIIPVTKHLKFKVTGNSDGNISLTLAIV